MLGCARLCDVAFNVQCTMSTLERTPDRQQNHLKQVNLCLPLNPHLLVYNAGDMGHLVPAAHDSHQLPPPAHHE